MNWFVDFPTEFLIQDSKVMQLVKQQIEIVPINFLIVGLLFFLKLPFHSFPIENVLQHS